MLIIFLCFYMIYIYNIIFMSGKNRYVTIFWEIGWTDLYDFLDQDKGGKYLGSHVSIFPLGPLGSMSKGI